MKKFFQIAAFAVVGFIAFTSASLRGQEYFIKIKVPGEPTPTRTQCAQYNDVHQQDPSGTEFWGLYDNTLGRFVTGADVASAGFGTNAIDYMNLFPNPNIRFGCIPILLEIE